MSGRLRLGVYASAPFPRCPRRLYLDLARFVKTQDNGIVGRESGAMQPKADFALSNSE